MMQATRQMNKNRRNFNRIAALLAVLILAACGTAPKTLPTPFPTAALEETFASGYRQIAERYIETVPVGDFAFDGISGLRTIDPDLSVARRGASMILARAGRRVAEFTVPAAGDTDGWAKLTVDITVAGGSVSPALKQADAEKILQAVFDGSLANLDRFSRYATAEKAAENRAKRVGFGGIGVRLRANVKGARIIAVFPDGPAERAQLRKGDLVTHIDAKAAAGLTAKQLRDLMRGPINSMLSLRVLRQGAGTPIAFRLERNRVVIPTVFHAIKDGIINLRVSGFNSRTSVHLIRNFREAEIELQEPARGVLIDLRGNPGGLLNQAIKVADLFLVDGKIVATRGRHPDSIHDYRAQGADIARGLPIVVLVDGKSASSAEIVAAALQDHERAVVIGSTSFGKGTVQTVARLPNDGELTLTWSRFVTPSGYVLHNLGVAPSICTSGASGDAAEVIARAISGYREASATMAAWRTVAQEDGTGRLSLRNTCPATRKKRLIDVEVAKRLLEDFRLYSRLVTLSPSVAAIAE